MFIKIICAWCGKFMGIKEAENTPLSISHSICSECKKKLEEETEALLHETKTIHP